MNEIILAATIFAILLCWVFTSTDREKNFNREREEWKAERQQLLDRIQANSFAEYKTAEVRVIKAQKDEKPEPQVQMV